MMNLEEMEKAAASQTRQDTKWPVLKHELEHVNWKLVIAIAFGFLMWYAGTAILDNLIHTCNPPACNEEP